MNATTAPRPIRAYQIVATGKDGTTVSAVVDLMRYAPGMTREQATSGLLNAVIAAKGPQWIEDYRINEIE